MFKAKFKYEVSNNYIMDMKDLQVKQADYDSKYWEINDSELEKIRHITLHMGKLLGKLSTYCEAKEHNKEQKTDQLQDEVVPDLLVYALQLSNLLNIKLDEKYLKRLEDNVKVVAKQNQSVNADKY